MGQYGNQPDFGTRAKNVVITGAPDDAATASPLNSAALYIGTGGTLVCSVVGGDADSLVNPGSAGYTIFKNIPNGTFFPVIVNCVWANDTLGTNTTCSDIVALY
jgi:hypothetical protein